MKGSKVLIIGGTSGMGLALAEAVLSAGARVTAVSRSPEKMPKSAAGKIDAKRLDVTNDKEIDAFFADGTEWDHVAVTAASGKAGPVKELALADAYAFMNSKFWGAYRIARAAHIKAGGSLTLMSGFWSQRPPKGFSIAAAINSVLEGLTRGLALELAPVRVNVIAPGVIETPLWDGMPEAARKDLFARTAKQLPVGRVGTSEDIAQMILAMMTNGFMTGTTVFIDGGGMLV